MSLYTTKLSTIVNTFNQGHYELDYLKRIENARPQIFNFDYGVRNAKFKEEFEKNFLIHFNDSEIAFETFGQFKIKLVEYCTNFLPIFEYEYNALQQAGADLLYNVSKSTQSGKNEQNATNGGKSKTMASEFPSNLLSKDSVSNVEYANNGGISESTSTARGMSTSQNEIYTRNGTALDNIEKFDKALNFWNSIYRKFEPLFFMLW